MQTPYIDEAIPQPTHFKFEDGSRILRRNIGIRLKDYTAFQWPPYLQYVYITEQIYYAMHFNPVDGGRVFLRNVGIRLRDYAVSVTKFNANHLYS
jgi:hypothetical protein